jgi:hypothetical protein
MLSGVEQILANDSLLLRLAAYLLPGDAAVLTSVSRWATAASRSDEHPLPVVLPVKLEPPKAGLHPPLREAVSHFHRHVDAVRLAAVLAHRAFRVPAIGLSCRSRSLAQLPARLFQHVEQLDLSKNPYLSDLSPLAQCCRLRSLSLSSAAVWDLSPLAAAAAAGAPLERLDLSDCERLDELAPLAACRALRAVCAGGCCALADAGVAALGACSQLQFLDVTDTKVTVGQLRALQALCRGVAGDAEGAIGGATGAAGATGPTAGGAAGGAGGAAGETPLAARVAEPPASSESPGPVAAAARTPHDDDAQCTARAAAPPPARAHAQQQPARATPTPRAQARPAQAQAPVQVQVLRVFGGVEAARSPSSRPTIGGAGGGRERPAVDTFATEDLTNRLTCLSPAQGRWVFNT